MPRMANGFLSHTAQCALLCSLFFVLPSFAVAAAGIAIVDFESYNLTPVEESPAEKQYVATLSGMLEQQVSAVSDVDIVRIEASDADRANAGFGYLFEHPGEAARLGKKYGADWIVVGRVHKPSFLFSYLMARLVNVHTAEVAEDLIVEIKGQQDVVTQKGIERLAQKLSVRLNHAPQH